MTDSSKQFVPNDTLLAPN
jgi:DNA mismatch repair protein MSH6